MSEISNESGTLQERRSRQKRAEIQIYRPGALRQLKEAAVAQSPTKLDTKQNKNVESMVIDNKKSSLASNEDNVLSQQKNREYPKAKLGSDSNINKAELGKTASDHKSQGLLSYSRNLKGPGTKKEKQNDTGSNIVSKVERGFISRNAEFDSKYKGVDSNLKYERKKPTETFDKTCDKKNEMYSLPNHSGKNHRLEFKRSVRKDNYDNWKASDSGLHQSQKASKQKDRHFEEEDFKKTIQSEKFSKKKKKKSPKNSSALSLQVKNIEKEAELFQRSNSTVEREKKEIYKPNNQPKRSSSFNEKDTNHIQKSDNQYKLADAVKAAENLIKRSEVENKICVANKKPEASCPSKPDTHVQLELHSTNSRSISSRPSPKSPQVKNKINAESEKQPLSRSHVKLDHQASAKGVVRQNDISPDLKIDKNKHRENKICSISISPFVKQKNIDEKDIDTEGPEEVFNNEKVIKERDSSCLQEIEVTKFIESLKVNDSSEDHTDSDCRLSDYEETEIDNAMSYIEFPNRSHNKTDKNSVEAIPKNKSNIKKSKHAQNIYWGDEKWTPSQRQRRKKSKGKEVNPFESPGRRGVIQIGFAGSANSPNDNSPNIANIPLAGQKLLFNPNNPSKPVAVTPSARDLPPSWESCNVHDNRTEGDENLNMEQNCSEANSEPGNKVDMSVFYSINKGEMDINYYVSSNQLPQEFRRIMDIRKHLQNCYRQLLITDIRLCQEKNIENALWKSLYYVIIEKLRDYISREPTLKDRSMSTLLILVEEGLTYLQSLLSALQEAYNFSLDAHIEEDLTTLPGAKNRVRQALCSCQKILLCMGDLARYREQYSQMPNFNLAKKWYEMALQVHPRNGRPFNQLAIIAVSQKRPLDVVYYYVRSLTAANPFTSARDSLISMFDDIRRKYDSMEKLPTTLNLQNSAREQEELSQRTREGSLRQEIWIRPDSGATYKRTLSQSDPEEERNACIDELMRLPPDQMMKHFLTSYLHCHGMLFSRVGLDHFIEILTGMLNLFQALLKLSPPRLSSTHLLQIMAVNMFAVDNTELRDTRIDSGYRSATQDLALLLSQEMFARLAETMVRLFPQNLNYTLSGKSAPSKLSHSSKGSSSPADKISSDERTAGYNDASDYSSDGNGLFLPLLAHFVPAAKVWCDWLLYQSSVWNPPPVSHDLQLGLETWGVIGELATIVKGIGEPDIPLTEDRSSSQLILVTLPEDSFLRGYTPLLTAHRGTYYAPRGVSVDRARDWVRITKFQLCLSQFLCGVEPPVLRLQKTDQGEILVPTVAVTPPDLPSVHKDSESSSDVEVEDSVSDLESNSDEESDIESSVVVEEGTPLASTVRLLAIRKKMLEKKHKQQRKMQALMEGAVTLEMEVRPRYLIPDTNCFIEHLEVIDALVKKNAYTLMVPLVVLSELDGLSRDAAVEKYGDVTHAVNVREGAAAAVHYIQGSKHSQLKCVTSQGSVLPSTMFTSEIDSQKDMTNDDKILSCCLQFCSATNKRRPIKEGVRRLYREVVLLTEDRNLRVKAYAHDVPVRDLLDFAHWAGVK